MKSKKDPIVTKITTLYECDPTKHTKCTKTTCQKECRLTNHEEFAKDSSKNEPKMLSFIKYYFKGITVTGMASDEKTAEEDLKERWFELFSNRNVEDYVLKIEKIYSPVRLYEEWKTKLNEN